MTRIRPVFGPKKALTGKMTEKRSIIPDDQKIDTRNFITFDQIFGKG